MKKRLFVDMDGVLAEYRLVEMKRLYEKDYFRNLLPQKNVVEAVKLLNENPDTEVFVLSAYLSDSEYALSEKKAWLDEHIPEIDEEHRIFSGYGMEKKAAVPNGVNKHDFLLDDYTKNLIEWSPGTGIKLLNGINHTRGTWRGHMVNKETDPKKLARDIHLFIFPPIRELDRERTLRKSEKERNKEFER